MVSYSTAKFAYHKHGDRGALRFLVCQVLSQDHETKKYSNIMGSSPGRLVTILPSLVAIGNVLVETMVLVFHMILT